MTLFGSDLVPKADYIALLNRVRELEAQNAALLADVNQDEGYERLKEALREGAELLHAFTPPGTPAVDAFIAKWSDRTPQTPIRQVHSKSEYKRLTALGVECVVTEKETGVALPVDCSGDVLSCPDNDGTGCVCAQHRASISCKRSHPHDAMDYDCKLMTLVERQACRARSQANRPETHAEPEKWRACLTCKTEWIVSDGADLPCPVCSEANRGGVKSE
jgi:hypothetical protein